MMRENADSSNPQPPPELVRVENLRVFFTVRAGRVVQKEVGVIRAVNGVSFTLRRGETLALVGAPGCGKSTVARALATLEEPSGGRILFRDQNVSRLRGKHRQKVRRRIQMIFSDPYSAFAPRKTVQDIVNEALQISGLRSEPQREQRLAELMGQVGLNLYLAVRYPRDLSGANRQRVALARALAAEPSLLLCDQPTDYLTPAAGELIIDLVHELSEGRDLTMLLTTRRLEMARHADRVAIMVQGRIVEMGFYSDLVTQPLHPFTQALLQAPPDGSAASANHVLDPLQSVQGCPYAPLCPLVEARCWTRFPAFVEGAPNHGVACHLVDPL